MLEVSNISVGYGIMTVVHNVSFRVEQREIVSLVGSNGAGKTSLLKAICGLITPQTGEVIFNGATITGLPAYELVRKGIALVPEGRQLFGKLSVYENLLMGAYIWSSKEEYVGKLREVYDLFPVVSERRKQRAETLSGGEQQMVAIARGLMSDPRLLVLDEPSMGLMPKLVKEVFKFVKKINSMGVAIILVEQNVKEALSLSDRSYVLKNGKIVIEGRSRDLEKSDDVRKAYLGM